VDTAAGGSGSITAAIVAKKRRRVIRAFVKAGATSPETAKTLAELGVHSSPILRVQKQRGVIVPVNEERYYLDEARELEVARKRRVIVLIAVAVILMLAWLIWSPSGN
jgi:hypothetical protein